MDDITYTFNQLNRERKSLVPSARKRTNGSKSHKCSLPCDNLTPAQQRKLSGPVRTYNITKPMSWEQFKTMPMDLQEAYLRYLHQRFGVTQQTISTVLFELSPRGLNAYVHKEGLDSVARRGDRDKPEGREALSKWVQDGGDAEPTTEELLTDNSEPVEPEVPVMIDEPVMPDEPVEPVSSDEPVEPVSSDEPDMTVNPTTRNPITSATLRMAGNADDILATLARFITGGKVMADVNITYLKEEN